MKTLFIFIDILIILLVCVITKNIIHFFHKRRNEKEEKGFEKNFEIFHDPTFKAEQKLNEKKCNSKQQINEKCQWDKLQTKYSSDSKNFKKDNKINTNYVSDDLGMKINTPFEQGGLNMNNDTTNYFNL